MQFRASGGKLMMPDSKASDLIELIKSRFSTTFLIK
jgi:hypothetical protein